MPRPEVQPQPSHRRSTKVCTRCRKRKTKCDFKFPACTPCELAKTPCMGYDPTTKDAVPRSLVRSLEARVAELETQLQAFRAVPEHLPLSMGSRISQATLSFAVPNRRSFLRSKVSPALFFRPSCPPMAVMREEQELSSPEASSDKKPAPQPDDAPENSVPRAVIDLSSVPFSAVKRMVKNYLDVLRPQYPCVSANLVANIVDRIRSETDATNTFFSVGNPAASGLGHFEYFVLFIVLAISAMTLTWKADNQARAASEAFFTSATKHLQALEDNDEIQALQISLLLAHYAHLCPERADNWTCITQAIRIVLDLGLHKGSPEALDPTEQRRRCRLFWVAYGMERSLVGNLRLPLSFPEESITTPLDVPADDGTSVLGPEDVEKQSSATHIYLLRALETEVHRVLHLEENVRLFGHVEISDWILDLSSRLAVWYDKAQTYARFYAILEFRHVQYNHLRARLHRPTPRLRVRGTEDRRIVLDATAVLIDDYQFQERRSRLFYPWHGTHILFEVCACSLEACWGLRTAEEPLRSTVDHMLHVKLPACVEILTKMGRRWGPALTSAKRIKPVLADIAAACAKARSNSNIQALPPDGADLYNERSITKRLEELLFSDGPLMWDQQVPPEQAFVMGMPDGNPVFPDAIGAFFDEMELNAWHPNWGLVYDDAADNPELRLDV